MKGIFLKMQIRAFQRGAGDKRACLAYEEDNVGSALVSQVRVPSGFKRLLSCSLGSGMDFVGLKK